MTEVTPKVPVRSKKVKNCETPPRKLKNSSGLIFKREESIGSGATSRCFRLKCNNGQVCALKTLAKSNLAKKVPRLRILRELSIQKGLSDLNAPSVVKYYDCFDDNTNIYIRMELCAANTLHQMVRNREGLREIEARYMFVKILEGVAFMHAQRIIHRDLKLANIFLTENMEPKIGDFGLACILDKHDSQRYGWLGTVSYMPPEIVAAPHIHGKPTDVWSLGICLYAMIMGRSPFEGTDTTLSQQAILDFKPDYIDSIMPDVSNEFKSFLKFVLNPDPKGRPVARDLALSSWIQLPTPSRIPWECLTKYVPFDISEDDIADNQHVLSKIQDVQDKAGIIRVNNDEKYWHLTLPDIIQPDTEMS